MFHTKNPAMAFYATVPQLLNLSTGTFPINNQIMRVVELYVRREISHFDVRKPTNLNSSSKNVLQVTFSMFSKYIIFKMISSGSQRALG